MAQISNVLARPLKRILERIKVKKEQPSDRWPAPFYIDSFIVLLLWLS